MRDGATLKNLYATVEAKALIQHMASREVRNLSKQLTVIVLEACERRGIDVLAVLREQGVDVSDEIADSVRRACA